MNRKWLIAILLVIVFCFTACGGKVISADGEYKFLDGLSVPSDFSIAESAEGGYNILQDGAPVGGIKLLDLTEAMEADPYLYQLSDHLIAAAEEIAKQNSDTEYDYITSSSAHAHLDIDFISPDGSTYRHYIMETESGYCDVWFNQTRVASGESARFIDQLFG